MHPALSATPSVHQFSSPSKQQGQHWALQATRILSSIQSYTLSPQKMGLLVAGLHLVCCWRYLAVLVAGYESRGLHCLWEIWGTAMVALVLGQLAKYLTPAVAEPDDDIYVSEDLDFVAAAERSASGLLPRPVKEGQELSVPLLLDHSHAAAAGKAAAAAVSGSRGTAFDDEDMATVKRRAQEEAAAKLASYRTEVQRLLSGISQEAASAKGTVSAQLLYRLADQLFASSINLSEFVELGGVPVVVAALQALTRSLAQQQQPQEEPVETVALPSMLQATWVLLQLSQGSPACKAALQQPQCSSALLAAARAVTALPPTAARATESILRNVWWVLLSLSDRPAASRAPHSSSSSSGFQDALWQQYQDMGAVELLQESLSLRHGPSAGWVAAANLGLLMQLGHQQAVSLQQQQSQQADGPLLRELSAAAVQAVLQEDSVAGLCFLMVQQRLEGQQAAPQEQQQQQQQQLLSRRMRVLVEGMLHYLLTFHSPVLLQLLIEQQLLGCFASHSCVRLGRLLVCQLLSSKGQEVMAAVEKGYELDVPLALAQIIPLKLHVKISQPPRPQPVGEIEPAAEGDEEQEEARQQQQQLPLGPAAAAAAAAAAADDLYTDILACRLLLQSQRLWELLGALCDEVQALPDTQQQQQATHEAQHHTAADVERECSVVSAGLGLVQHLMSRDLQLQAARHVRGDCVSDSSLSCTTSSSRSLEEALAAPDHSGTYSRVLEGMVPAGELPTARASAAPASSSSSSMPAEFSLPELKGAVVVLGSANPGKSVLFQFGQLQHAVDAATFKKIKHCSKLVHSILGRAQVATSAGVQEPVTLLAIPQFTDEANRWVVQCLERWLSTGSLAGFSAMQAAKLWVAADFLQVDELQVACEDVMAAGFREPNPQQHMQVAAELCTRHTDSGSRLLRLLVQQLLKRVCEGDGPATSSTAEPSTRQQQQQPGLRLLQQLLAQHTGLLLPVMHAELRDRLVTLCMLNAGQDAEDPSGVVG